MSKKKKVIILICVLSIVLSIFAVTVSASQIINGLRTTTNYILPMDIDINYIDTFSPGDSIYRESDYNALQYDPTFTMTPGTIMSIDLTGIYDNDTVHNPDLSYGNIVRNAMIEGNFTPNASFYTATGSFIQFSSAIGEDLVDYDNQSTVTDYIKNYHLNHVSSGNALSNCSIFGYPKFSYSGYIDTEHLHNTFNSYMPEYLKYGMLFPVASSFTGLNISAEYVIVVEYDTVEFYNNEYTYNHVRRVNTVKNIPAIRHEKVDAYYYLDDISRAYHDIFSIDVYHANIDLDSILFDSTYGIDLYETSYIHNLQFYIRPLGTSLYTNSAIMDYKADYPESYPMISIELDYNNAGVIGQDAVEAVRGGYDAWVASNARSVSYVSLNNFNFVDWIGDSLNGIFQADVIGSISLGDILFTVLGVAFVIMVLKFFAGG